MPFPHERVIVDAKNANRRNSFTRAMAPPAGMKAVQRPRPLRLHPGWLDTVNGPPMRLGTFFHARQPAMRTRYRPDTPPGTNPAPSSDTRRDSASCRRCTRANMRLLRACPCRTALLIASRPIRSSCSSDAAQQGRGGR